MERISIQSATLTFLFYLVISACHSYGPPSPEPNLSVSLLDERTLFTYDDASVGCYRIPIMLRTSKGTIIVAAEGRKRKKIRWVCDDYGPKFIAVRKSFDDGLTWDPVQFVFDDPSPSGMNLGTIFEDETNRTVYIQFIHGFFAVSLQTTHQTNTHARTKTDKQTVSQKGC